LPAFYYHISAESCYNRTMPVQVTAKMSRVISASSVCYK